MEKTERGVQIKIAIISGLCVAVFMSLFWTYQDGYKKALIGGPIVGFIYGLLMYLFARSRRTKQQTEIDKDSDDMVLMSSAANHFLNGEAVGGKLYLFSDKLLFKSHRLNIQNHQLQVDLQTVKEVKFCNTMGIIPNGLQITTDTDSQQRFVVNNRSLWKQEIQKAKGLFNITPKPF